MLNVGIIGLGTIGKVVAKALDDGMNGLRLEAVAAGRQDRARAHLATLETPVDIMPIDKVAERCGRKMARPGSSLRQARCLGSTLCARRRKAQSIP